MRLRCWLDEPPAYTLDIDTDTRLVLDCPAALLKLGVAEAEAGERRAAWLAECTGAAAVLVSDHTALGALPVLTERTSFDGAVLLTRPTAQIGRWLLAAPAAAPEPEPPFTAAEAARALGKCMPLAYSEAVELPECTPGTALRVTPWSAGRCLGSAAWLIEVWRPAGVSAFLYIGMGAVHQLTHFGPKSLGALLLPLRAGEPKKPSLRMLRHPRALDIPTIRESLHRAQASHLTVVFGGRLRPDGEGTPVTETPAAADDAPCLASVRAAAEDDQVGRSVLVLLKHVSTALAAGGVAVVAVGEAEPLFCLLDLVELVRSYLLLTARGAESDDAAADLPPICIVGRGAAALVAYAETCAEWTCKDKLGRVFHRSTNRYAAPFNHGALRAEDRRRPGLVIAEDLAELSAGGLEGGYAEPCVLLTMGDDVLDPLLRSHNKHPHCFVATEALGREAIAASLLGYRRGQTASLVEASRQGKRMVERPAGAALLSSRAAAAASPKGGAEVEQGQAAEVHYAPVDLRMSRGQCVACTADLSSAGAEEGSGWTMEVVLPRQLAPRMRQKRQRSASSRHGAGAGAQGEELLSLRGGSHPPPAGLEVWSVVPGATINHLGGVAAGAISAE